MSKKAKYTCKVQDKWLLEFNYLSKVTDDNTSAHCNLCKWTFSVGAGGRNDITRHSKNKRHTALTNAAKTSSSIADHFSVGNNEIDKVTNAEGLFSAMIAKHNIPLSVSDHFTKLVPKMFPDSKIAKAYGSGRTKTTAIIRVNSVLHNRRLTGSKEALAPHYDANVNKLLVQRSFGLLIDESSDTTNKCLVILARIYLPEEKTVRTLFVDMARCPESTAAGIFEVINNVFSKRSIPWSNVCAFNSDNCSVMKGIRNGVIAKIKEVSPNVVDVGCVCHLANLAMGAALKSAPVNLDMLLCDINTHFCHSAKRKETFKEFQEFVEAERQRLLKHTPTRWLSLRRCVERLLGQYDALKSYFISHPEADKPRSKPGLIRSVLLDPKTLPWCHFILYAFQPFYKFTNLFQTEELVICDLDDQMKKLVKTTMAMHLSVADVNRLDFTKVTEQDVEKCGQLSDLDLSVGDKCRALVIQLEEDGLDSTEFFSDVRAFLQRAVKKMIKIMPLDHAVIKYASIIKPENREKFKYQQLASLASSLKSNCDRSSLESEYLAYQVEDMHPSGTAIDPKVFWSDAQASYPTLSDLMQTIMCVPHSNASSERMFSMLRKVHTELRGNLCSETIRSLMTIKVNEQECCHGIEFTKPILKKMKRAADDHNTKYSKNN